MPRRIREHSLRPVLDLAGFWDFAFLGEVEPDEVSLSEITFNDRMMVPGNFDATPAYAGKRGLAAYRTTVRPLQVGQQRLMLDGLHHWGRIFVNGAAIADHHGGFTRFYVDFNVADPKPIELVILIDNRFDYQRSPLHQPYFDWYHYGGIARGAELHALGSAWIDALRISTTALNPPTIELSLDYDSTTIGSDLPFTISVNEDIVLSETITLTDKAGSLTRTLTLPGAALWSPQNPNLHQLQVQLGSDDMRERIGLRQITVVEGEVRLNNQPLQLLGFNRHEAHPEFGHAIPAAIHFSDLQILQDMGCNFVRGSHYPQDRLFLDLCDEIGFLVWNESIGWQHTSDHLTDPHFLQAQQQHIDEMVAMSTNHASVIMWGILNESHSNRIESRPAYERLLGRLRELDASRPVTYACNHPFDDECLDLVDIVSINCYPGWYHGGISYIPEHIDNIITRLKETGQGHKPLIISEIGAGAIYGWRDNHQGHWSEPYQAQLLEKVIDTLFVSGKRAMGLAIWQYCDCRTAEDMPKPLGRPRNFNNKGVVDEYRRPKQAYEIVKRMFTDLRKSG